MELFRYTDPTNFRYGQAICCWDSCAWSERYRTPGEFEIQAKLSSGLREDLPIGSLVSHTKTLDVMIVESHQVSEDIDTDPVIKVSGRGLESVLEHRIVGQNWNWGVPPASIEASLYQLANDYSWFQIVELINDHIQTGTVLTPQDAISKLYADTEIATTGVPTEARTIGRGSVLEKVLELLAYDDLGIRVIRRNNFPGHPGNVDNTILRVHAGEDQRGRVIFSTKTGDIDLAEYLKTIKSYKNAALVSGKFVEAMVPGSQTGINKRVMLVDGGDIDGHLQAVPTGATLTAIRAAMTTRGVQALRAQKKLEISRADISATPTFHYRYDYNIGDIVSVDVNYGGFSTPMRVVENVEIDDENGESSFPTLEFME